LIILFSFEYNLNSLFLFFKIDKLSLLKIKDWGVPGRVKAKHFCLAFPFYGKMGSSQKVVGF